MAKRQTETPEQIEEIKQRFKNARVFAVQYITSYGSATRVWDGKGYVKKYTLDEARETAKRIFERSGTTTKIYKGWTVIEVFES